MGESAAAERVFSSFKLAINALTLQDQPQDSISPRIDGYLRLRDVRPFRTQHRDWLPAARCIFNRIVGEPNAGGLQLRFVRFLDQADSVTAFAYVDQDRFGGHPPASLADLATMFRDYQPHA